MHIQSLETTFFYRFYLNFNVTLGNHSIQFSFNHPFQSAFLKLPIMSYSPTKPLPYDSSDNCPIYNPFSSPSHTSGEDDRGSIPLKKARRVVSSNSLSAFLQRRKSQRMGSRSRKSSRRLKGDDVSVVGDVYTSYASSPSSSDLESLPDLTDDDADTPETTPIKPIHKFTFLDTISPGKRLIFADNDTHEQQQNHNIPK